MPKKDKKKESLWRRLFPVFQKEDESAQTTPDIMPAAMVYEQFAQDVAGASDPSVIESAQLGVASQADPGALYPLNQLPQDRLSCYSIYQSMTAFSFIDSAIKMHLAHALSAKEGSNEVVSIESTSDKEDPVTIDLRNTFQEKINQNIHQWAYSAARDGIAFCRIYGKQGKGIELIQNDFYTHPRFIKMYEKAGQLAGYTSAHQQVRIGKVQLMEPWKFVKFRIPAWGHMPTYEPVKIDAKIFDMASDDWEDQPLVESQNYGASLIATAYSPWVDLMESLLSMNMSRKNAARLERLIGVNTGKLSPQRAAQYLNTIADQLHRANKANVKDKLKKGYIQTVLNHLIPIWGDGKGRLEMSTIEPNPNIRDLEDIMMNIKLCGSALGIDVSLLGFGDQLAGALGEGGFFRISIMAAIKAMLLRRAMATGIEQLFDIHVFWKYGKVFLPGQKPWRLNFNSVSSALEREEKENADNRVNFTTMVASLIQVIDPEMMIVDKKVFANWAFTDILKVDEEKVRAMFPDKPKEEPPKDDAEKVFESASILSGVDKNDIKNEVYTVLKDFYQGGMS